MTRGSDAVRFAITRECKRVSWCWTFQACAFQPSDESLHGILQGTCCASLDNQLSISKKASGKAY